MARQVFPFLLARNCRMLPSNPSNPPKHARPALGAASCATPRYAKSFLFYWPETASNPSNPPNWRLELPAVAGQVFPFFTALQLPDAPFKPSKPSDTCHLWCGLHLVQFLALLELPNCHIFRFYWLDNAGCFLETVQALYLEARCLPPWLLLGRSSLPFASPQTPKKSPRQLRPGTLATGICC